MKLIFHIVRKDLSALRWWILGWAVAVALPMLEGVALVYRAPAVATQASSWRDTQGWLVTLAGIVAFVLTVRLFQEDSVCGDTRFWLTRPISRLRLLGAKVVAATVIFGVLPVGLSMVWWSWCGFTPVQIIVAIRDVILQIGVVVLPAAAIAVFTDTLSRALLWSFVYLAMACGAWVLALVAGQSNPRLLFGLASLFVGVCDGAALVMVAGRYVFRSASPVVVGTLGLVGVALALEMPRIWERAPEPLVFHPERTASVEMHFERATAGQTTGTIMGITTEFGVDGVPENSELSCLGRRQTWRLRDGPEVPSRDIWAMVSRNPRRFQVEMLGLHAPPADPETEAWREAKQRERPDLFGRRRLIARQTSVDLPNHDTYVTAWADFRPVSFARVKTDHASCTTQLTLALSRRYLAVDQPLEAGARRVRGGYGLRVARFDRRGDAGTADVVTTEPSPLIDSIFAPEPWKKRLSAINLISINWERHEMWGAGRNGAFNGDGMRVNGIDIRWWSAVVNGDPVIRNGKRVPRPGWLDHPSLGMVVVEPQAIFSREVTVPDVVVADPEGEPDSVP